MARRNDDFIPDFMQHDPYGTSPNNHHPPHNVHKRKQSFVQKHIFGIILIIVLLIIGLITGTVVGISKASHKKAESGMSSADTVDSGDETINSLIADNESKNQKIQEYESRISELEAQLAAKRASRDGVKTCYLTFDDGPSEVTLRILDVLKEKNVKATFFVKGGSKLSYVQREKDEGHTVALHTYSHEYSDVYRSTDAYFTDLQKISDAVESIIGEKCKLIRFPGGSSNTVSAKYCPGIMTELTKEVADRGYSYFDWNSDSGDATGDNVAVEKLMKNIRSGGTSAKTMVVLMHDTDAKRTTAEALPQIIDFYASNGYGFAPLTQSTPTVHHGVNN